MESHWRVKSFPELLIHQLKHKQLFAIHNIFRNYSCYASAFGVKIVSVEYLTVLLIFLWVTCCLTITVYPFFWYVQFGKTVFQYFQTRDTRGPVTILPWCRDVHSMKKCHHTCSQHSSPLFSKPRHQLQSVWYMYKFIGTRINCARIKPINCFATNWAKSNIPEIMIFDKMPMKNYHIDDILSTTAETHTL